MALRRFLVQLGFGVDMHGQDPTKAACRAVADAISRNCLCGLMEICGLTNPDEMEVEILVAVPKHQEVDTYAVLDVIPYGRKTIRVIPGGMSARGIKLDSIGDHSDEMIIANASVTVLVDDSFLPGK